MNDSELLKLLKKDADSGLSLLISQYTGLVCSVIRAHSRGISAEDTEECASDVFFDFYRNVKRFDPARGSIKSYLCTAARNKAVDMARSRRGEGSNVSMDDEEAFLALADNFSVDEEVFGKEERKALFRMIEALGKPDSEIIVRKFLLRQSTKDIAERLGMSAGNVDVRTHRALAKLRKQIGGKEE